MQNLWPSLRNHGYDVNLQFSCANIKVSRYRDVESLFEGTKFLNGLKFRNQSSKFTLDHGSMFFGTIFAITREQLKLFRYARHCKKGY